MPPSRRTLLRTCGLALSLGSAGCLSSDGGTRATSETTRTTTGDAETTTGPSRTTGRATTGEETTDTEETTVPGQTTVPDPPEVSEVEPATVDRGVPRSPTIESDRHEPFRAFVVGDRPAAPGNHYETPHVWVWNVTDEAKVFELALTTGGTELLRDGYEFPAGAPLAFAFRDPRAYRLTVRVGEREEVVTVERDRFHCNDSATDVIVSESDVETETVSTALYCTTTP